MTKPTISIDEYSPLVLAYLGDAVLELFIREALVVQGNIPVSSLHKHATSLVCAEAQSRAFALIEPLLAENELKIYKRGRNAKTVTSPKNAPIAQYRRATGFEALLGYLYLNNKRERLQYIIQKAFLTTDDEDKD